MRTQPQKTKRETDTSKFAGLDCTRCGERVKISDGSGYWRVDPQSQDVTAFHLRCVLERA